MHEPFRIPPLLPAAGYKTYQITSPIPTHFAETTCAEVNCTAFEFGWVTRIDESTQLGQQQAYYIRSQSGRKFEVTRDPMGLTLFAFESGQQCFATHKRKLDRPEVYSVRDGDWRGNPFGTRPTIHTRPEYWVEDFAEHQQGVADRMNQG